MGDNGRSGHLPVQVVEAEVGPGASHGAPQLLTVDGRPVVAGLASVLVRAHGVPLARLRVELPADVDRASLLSTVRPLVATELAEHVEADQEAGVPAGNGACAAWLPLPDRRPRVTVVIPTVGREDLGPCLDSLLRQDYDGDYEVLVVDNAPNDQRRGLLDDVLARRGDPAHRLRRLHEPRPGVSHARNTGLASATGEITAFVDDDVVVDRRWLRAVVAGFGAAEDGVCVTGLVLPWQLETTEQTWFEQYGGFAKGFHRRVYDLHEHRGDSPLFPYLPGHYGTGANVAFRTDWFRRLGGFDPVLGGRRPIVGGEDIDVLLRTVLAGGRLVYEPQALLWYQPYREYQALRRQMLIYGRGLSSVILKAALADRKVALDIARRLPIGLRFLLDPASDKNAQKQDFPAELTRLELAGIVSGPFTYTWARLAAAQSGKRATAPVART